MLLTMILLPTVAASFASSPNLLSFPPLDHQPGLPKTGRGYQYTKSPIKKEKGGCPQDTRLLPVHQVNSHGDNYASHGSIMPTSRHKGQGGEDNHSVHDKKRLKAELYMLDVHPKRNVDEQDRENDRKNNYNKEERDRLDIHDLTFAIVDGGANEGIRDNGMLMGLDNDGDDLPDNTNDDEDNDEALEENSNGIGLNHAMIEGGSNGDIASSHMRLMSYQ